jgi:hypothetical protein
VIRNQYATTPMRSAVALLVAFGVAIGVAQTRVWGAFSALGPEEWFRLLQDHFQTIVLDYGPGFVLALIVWVVFDRLGLRDAKYGVLVGVACFYLGPRLYGLLYFLQFPFWSFVELADLFVPTLNEIVAGAVLSVLMWGIAYWRAAQPETSADAT